MTQNTPFTSPTPAGPPPRSRARRPYLRRLGAGLLVSLAVLAGLVFLAWLGRPADPVYAGRPLSAWLEQLPASDPQARAAATNAIVALGSNAVAPLLLHLTAPDPAFSRVAQDAGKYLPHRLWVWTMRLVRPRAGIERRHQAAIALGLLGPAARPAVPLLAAAVRDPDPRVSDAAIEALRHLRPEGLVALASEMDTTNQTRFAHLGSAIARCGPDASLVATQLVAVLFKSPEFWHSHLLRALAAGGVATVPPLAQGLTSPDPRERKLAVAGLQALTFEDYASVKAVAALTRHPDPATRRGAVQVLGGRTFWDRRAIAAVSAALGDADAEVRREAIGVLVAAAEWTDQATNALPGLQALVLMTAGPEREAAQAALERLRAIVP